MDYVQSVLFVVTMVGLFSWNRSESRSDIRHMDAKLESQRNLIDAMHKDSRMLIDAIHAEIKDFHGRLCAIEERNKGK